LILKIQNFSGNLYLAQGKLEVKRKLGSALNIKDSWLKQLKEHGT